MQTSYSWRSKLWLTATLVLTCNASWAEGRIVKWVDEKGATHYGDSIPPQYSGRDNTELNQQGHVVKRNKTTDSQTKTVVEAETKLSVEQQRHDKALLAAYTTEQEFDLARDRNLQTDQAAIEGLNQNMGSIKERMAASKKLAGGFNQRKKPVPPYITQDMKEQQDEISKIEGQIADRQKSMDATRQRFETEKQRFIQLKLDPNAPLPVAAPAASVAPEAAKPTTPAPVAAKPAPAAVPAVEKPVVKPSPATPTTKPAPAAPATATPVKKIKRVVAP